MGAIVETIPEGSSPILVVDDDVGMLSSIEATLCSFGLPRPALVSDGRRVTALIEEHGFHVVLLDILMPGMNGMDVLRRVKAEFPATRCIMVTAVDTVDKAMEAIREGALDYLVKPIQRRKLREVVQTALQLAADDDGGDGAFGIDERRRYEGMLKQSMAATDVLRSENAVLLENMKKEKVIFEKVINSLPWAVLITEADTRRIADFNRSASRLFGCEREELIGNPADSLHSDANALEAFKKHMGETSSPETGFELKDVNLKKRDGTVFPSDYSLFPIQDDTGRRIAHVHLIRHVADHRRIDSQFQKIHKMAAIGALASGIAHDFNNILTPIMGYAEIAIEDLPKDSPVLQSLREILKAGHRAKDMVRQILVFNRMEEQKKESMILGTIVEEAIGLIKQTLPASVTFRETIKSRQPVMTDPAKIHQLVMNLCINAFHALPNGEGEIHASIEDVRVTESDAVIRPAIAPGGYAKLTIRDTGCGMSADVMERIFEPYFTTKTSEQGTGLGLSIVRGIVENHEGHIRVQSEPGRGTTFEIFLPVIETRPNEPMVRDAEKFARKGTETILLVDDERQGVLVFSKMLESLGYSVVTEMSPTAALERFQRSPETYQLLITDLTMPEMNGVDLAKRITRIRPNLPVVLMSGFSGPVDRETMASAGIAATIMKPCLKIDLANTVRDLLDEKKTD